MSSHYPMHTSTSTGCVHTVHRVPGKGGKVFGKEVPQPSIINTAGFDLNRPACQARFRRSKKPYRLKVSLIIGQRDFPAEVAF